jgi:hypothetical protein
MGNPEQTHEWAKGATLPIYESKSAKEIIEAGPEHYVVLADGETYTLLKGAVIIDHFGTVYDAMELVDAVFAPNARERDKGVEKAMIARLT